MNDNAYMILLAMNYSACLISYMLQACATIFSDSAMLPFLSSTHLQPQPMHTAYVQPKTMYNA